MSLLLCVWQPEGHGLPVGPPFDLDVAETLILRGEERSEFPPPFWQSVILLQVRVDPLTCIVWVSINSSLGLLCLLGRVVAGLGHGGWS